MEEKTGHLEGIYRHCLNVKGWVSERRSPCGAVTGRRHEKQQEGPLQTYKQQKEDRKNVGLLLNEVGFW